MQLWVAISYFLTQGLCIGLPLIEFEGDISKFHIFSPQIQRAEHLESAGMKKA